MTDFVSFIDTTGENAPKAPLVKGGIRAYYATGSSWIEETSTQLAAARTAGMGIILIDQSPGLTLFSEGSADVADVESGAGTPASAAAAVKARQAHGWQSTLYVSYGSLNTLKDAITDSTGVLYGVADYSWSLADAETLLNENDDWAYVQYGDNLTNAADLVPGTSVTIGEADCDIDVAKASWAAQFLPAAPGPDLPEGVSMPSMPGTIVSAQMLGTTGIATDDVQVFSVDAGKLYVARWYASDKTWGDVTEVG